MKSKLRELSVLKSIVEGEKRNGKKIVFANGIFDVIHVGHVRYLREAKGLGKILIVAVNSDSSTKMLKGANRPYTPLKERLEILAEFHCIDYLISFEENDVRKLLTALRPDIHAKGTDYTVDTVPERDIVESYGGRVAITGDEKTHSSTSIINVLEG